MSIGTIFFMSIGVLYLMFAFRDPPEAIARYFSIPAAFVFFPEEHRVKLGRITVGVLIIGAGIGWAVDIPGARIVGGIVGILFIALQIAARWKIAGDVSDAMDAEQQAARASFEQLKQDPRFLHLQRYLGAKYRLTFDRAPDPATYCVRYICLQDAMGQHILTPGISGARWLVAYLERGDSRARLQASVDLHTGVCGETELGWMAWSSAIPAL